jgi:hypothetical protein
VLRSRLNDEEHDMPRLVSSKSFASVIYLFPTLAHCPACDVLAAKARYKHLAKTTLLLAAAAARRMEIAAENAADSYARAIKNAAEEQPAKKAAKKKTG